MAQFRLQDRITDLQPDVVPVNLKGFGEEFREALVTRAYPAYEQALTDADDEGEEDAELARFNAALETERTRLSDRPRPKLSDDPIAAMLQDVMDLPRSLAERKDED